MTRNTNAAARPAVERDAAAVTEDYELRDRSQKLGVTPERLKEAVKPVGS
jgi:hypothetical protein